MFFITLTDGNLHYKRNSETAGLVLFTREERKRVLKECHNDAGGAHTLKTI